MDNSIQVFTNILRKYERIPKPEVVQPTFMEISGFPHYENVCSNILSFYFDSSKPHGFGDLLIRSLLEVIGYNIQPGELIKVTKVSREALTTENKRIDLIIETSTYIVAIENKIYADLYNDLDEYARYINNKYASKNKKLFLVVLALRKIPEHTLSSGFISLTYLDFFNRISLNWGRYIFKAHPKYSLYLTDFFSTILKFTEKPFMDSEMRRFLIENQQEVNALVESWKELQNYIEEQVRILQRRIGEQKANVRQYIWAGFDLVHDFTMPDGVVIAVDCYLKIDKFNIRVWKRKGKVDEVLYLNKLILFQNNHSFTLGTFNSQDINWNSGVEFPNDFSIEEMAQVLIKVLQSIRFVEGSSELNKSSTTEQIHLLT